MAGEGRRPAIRSAAAITGTRKAAPMKSRSVTKTSGGSDSAPLFCAENAKPQISAVTSSAASPANVRNPMFLSR